MNSDSGSGELDFMAKSTMMLLHRLLLMRISRFGLIKKFRIVGKLDKMIYKQFVMISKKCRFVLKFWSNISLYNELLIHLVPSIEENSIQTWFKLILCMVFREVVNQ